MAKTMLKTRRCVACDSSYKGNPREHLCSSCWRSWTAFRMRYVYTHGREPQNSDVMRWSMRRALRWS